MRAEIDGLQGLMETTSQALIALDERFKDVRKVHLVRAFFSLPLSINRIRSTQNLHYSAQVERLGLPRSMAVEGMEACNKHARSFLVDRSNHLNVRQPTLLLF